MDTPADTSPFPDAPAPLPAAAIAHCRAAGLGDVVSAEALKGGMISLTRRLVTSSGYRFVLKQSADAPDGLYDREAEGLRALTAPGAPRTPRVLAVAGDCLLLEDLGSSAPSERYWEDFGRALALQHAARTSPRFGFHRDNYLGRLPQHNGWTDDGHAFFARNRLLRYLSEPLCGQTLTDRDRRDVERLAARLPDLIPAQPAALLHGDLWSGNMLVGPGGVPAMIDPSVHYGWAEAELSMARQAGGVPDAFFGAYAEINPPEPGWPGRLELLHLREILSVIAHFGDRYGSLARLREVTSRFA